MVLNIVPDRFSDLSRCEPSFDRAHVAYHLVHSTPNIGKLSLVAHGI